MSVIAALSITIVIINELLQLVLDLIIRAHLFLVFYKPCTLERKLVVNILAYLLLSGNSGEIFVDSCDRTSWCLQVGVTFIWQLKKLKSWITSISSIYRNLQFLNHVIDIKSKVLLPQVYVTLSDFGYPLHAFGFSAPKIFLII